jgi:hypothetical protein
MNTLVLSVLLSMCNQFGGYARVCVSEVIMCHDHNMQQYENSIVPIGNKEKLTVFNECHSVVKSFYPVLPVFTTEPAYE